MFAALHLVLPPLLPSPFQFCFRPFRVLRRLRLSSKPSGDSGAGPQRSGAPLHSASLRSAPPLRAEGQLLRPRGLNSPTSPCKTRKGRRQNRKGLAKTAEGSNGAQQTSAKAQALPFLACPESILTECKPPIQTDTKRPQATGTPVARPPFGRGIRG